MDFVTGFALFVSATMVGLMFAKDYKAYKRWRVFGRVKKAIEADRAE